MNKILVVEDDLDLSNIIKDYLENENFIVTQSFNGEEAMNVVSSFEPDLIVLDIMMPKLNGIEVCRQIRTTSICPIIMISAKSSDADKMLSLGIGADDYLTKPFSLIELVARVKSHLRRYKKFTKEETNQVKVFGKLKIDTKGYKVMVDDSEINLTSKEFKLLDFLSTHPGQVFSKDQLIDQIWGYNDYIDANTIAVYVGRLREKLTAYDACYIKTVWGVGYKWEE